MSARVGRPAPPFAPGPLRYGAEPSPADVPLVFVVPMPPPLTNASGRSRHWRAVHAARTAYWHTLDGLRAGRHLPPPPAAPLARVALRSAMVLGGAMDDDNAVARHKWLVDWLVHRDYLASDRRTCVRWSAFPEQVVTRQRAASITLTVTPGWPEALSA